MPKTTIKVDVLESLKELASEQASKKHFASVSEYVQHLIRTDLERQRKQELIELFIQQGYSGRPLSREEFNVWMSIFSITGTG